MYLILRRKHCSVLIKCQFAIAIRNKTVTMVTVFMVLTQLERQKKRLKKKNELISELEKASKVTEKALKKQKKLKVSNYGMHMSIFDFYNLIMLLIRQSFDVT